MIEKIRKCESILEELASPASEGNWASGVIEKIRAALENLRQVDSEFKEAATTLILNRQLTSGQFYLLGAFGTPTMRKNTEFEAYCAAIRCSGWFAITLCGPESAPGSGQFTLSLVIDRE